MPKKDSQNHFLASLKNAFNLLRDGHYSVLYNEIRNRLHSESLSFGLQRDLQDSFEKPAAKIKINVRPLHKEDIESLLGEEVSEMVNPRIIASQYAMLDAKIPTCYVAVTSTDKPCYMQWLIGSEDNDKIQSHFKGVFPPLKPQEALLEAAFGNPNFRGLRIMPAAMAQIAEKASLINARWVNTFVDVSNIASLKGCRRSGFEPYVLRKEKWFLFRLTISFHPLPDYLLEEYEMNTADRNHKSMNGSRIESKFEPEIQGAE